MSTHVARSTPYFELVEAQALAGCPICRLSDRSTERYLDSLLYEAVLDPGVRERLKSTYGFCQEHVAMLHRRPGRSLGVALIYESVVRRLIGLLEEGHMESGSLVDRLRGRGGERSGGAALATRLRPAEPCPACANRHQAEHSYAELLAVSIGDEPLFQAYADGDGLCLPHLAHTIAFVRDEPTLQRLLQPQLDRYRAMQADLAEYIRKSDHRFQGEPLGEEGDVWLRAMNAMAGGAGMGFSARHGARRAEDSDRRP